MTSSDGRGDRKERAGAPEGLTGKGLRVGVVAARWNRDIVDRLRAGVDRGLAALDVDAADVVELSVPGSFEVPFAAKLLAASGQVDAVIALGCVIRGETAHFELVAGECARGVQDAQLATGVPIAFGVLTTDDLDQALARSEGPGGHNVGEESAMVAVEMARARERFASQS
jgi:6,7-dimethyl-8-ribityllumazine synthase